MKSKERKELNEIMNSCAFDELFFYETAKAIEAMTSLQAPCFNQWK